MTLLLVFVCRNLTPLLFSSLSVDAVIEIVVVFNDILALVGQPMKSRTCSTYLGRVSLVRCCLRTVHVHMLTTLGRALRGRPLLQWVYLKLYAVERGEAHTHTHFCSPIIVRLHIMSTLCTCHVQYGAASHYQRRGLLPRCRFC